MTDIAIKLRDVFNHGKISKRKLFRILQELDARIKALEGTKVTLDVTDSEGNTGTLTVKGTIEWEESE